MNYIELDQLASLIMDAYRVVVTAHISPDGDAIGSVTGLSSFLNMIGKDAYVVLHDKIPSYLSYLDKEGKVFSLEENEASQGKIEHLFETADTIIVCDLNNLHRTGGVSSLIDDSKATKIVIDHHQEPKEFADYYYVDTDASSTCQMIARLIINQFNKPGFIENEFQIEEMATSLYTGIFTDSGGFAYPRTTKELLTIAGQLVDWGADPVDISKKINQSKSKGAIRLLGRALDKMQLLKDESRGLISLSRNDFHECHSSSEDKEGIVNYPMQIESVKISCLITEMPDGIVKVSLRSKDLAVNGLAKKYGGGGHLYAAACRFEDKSLEEVSSLMTRELELLD